MQVAGYNGLWKIPYFQFTKPPVELNMYWLWTAQFKKKSIIANFILYGVIYLLLYRYKQNRLLCLLS